MLGYSRRLLKINDLDLFFQGYQVIVFFDFTILLIADDTQTELTKFRPVMHFGMLQMSILKTYLQCMLGCTRTLLKISDKKRKKKKSDLDLYFQGD